MYIASVVPLSIHMELHFSISIGSPLIAKILDLYIIMLQKYKCYILFLNLFYTLSHVYYIKGGHINKT